MGTDATMLFENNVAVLQNSSRSDKVRIEAAKTLIDLSRKNGVRALRSFFQEMDKFTTLSYDSQQELVEIVGATGTHIAARACLDAAANLRKSPSVRGLAARAVSKMITDFSNAAGLPASGQEGLRKLKTMIAPWSRETEAARLAVSHIIDCLAEAADDRAPTRGSILTGVLATKPAQDAISLQNR